MKIIESEERYAEQQTDVLNAVAGEKLYLSVYGGFTVNSIIEFQKFCRKNNFPQYLALNDNDEVIGWCDIVPRNTHPSNIGFIGLGLLADYREQGLGKKLMTYALDNARSYGFTEIRLECRADNKRAIHVYKELGFHKYAFKRNALQTENDRFDIVYMRKRLRRSAAKHG